MLVQTAGIEDPPVSSQSDVGMSELARPANVAVAAAEDEVETEAVTEESLEPHNVGVPHVPGHTMAIKAPVATVVVENVEEAEIVVPMPEETAEGTPNVPEPRTVPDPVPSCSGAPDNTSMEVAVPPVEITPVEASVERDAEVSSKARE